MSRTGTVRHTHQYFKREDGRWACSGIDGCTHYMPKNMSPAPLGHMSMCWGSGEPHAFQLTPTSMTQDKPMCDKCLEQVDNINDFLKRFGLSDDKLKYGLEAFGAKPGTNKSIHSFKPKNDEIEVIEPNEDHSPDCSVFITGECTCK